MDQRFVSVIFVTNNRKFLLTKAIKAALAQTVPIEVIVMDDASTDGTGEWIRMSYPEVIYCRSDKKKGPAYQRNAGAEKAKSDMLFFFDDDTIAEDPFIIETTLKDIDHPNVGAIAIPFINILQGQLVQMSAPDPISFYAYHAFVAAAFAIRKSLFQQLGGFREEYFYMGEEGDLCIRLLAAGYYVKAGSCQPALHYQPANRISFAADFYGRRNDLLFIHLNIPKAYQPIFLCGSILKGLWFGIRVRRLKNMLKGMKAGLQLLFDRDFKKKAKPVGTAVFHRYRYLKHHEPLLIKQ